MAYFKAKVLETLSMYGNTYPPIPQFADWPKNMSSLNDICKRAIKKMNFERDYSRFRQKLREDLKLNIDTKEIIEEIDSLLSEGPFSRKLFGLIGCVMALKLSYRWCTIPCTEELIKVDKLEFPEEIEIIEGKLTSIFKIKIIPSFRLYTTTAVYNEKGELDTFQYLFNEDPDKRRTELNFHIAFMRAELLSYPLIIKISEFLTHRTKRNLQEIKEIIDTLNQTFSSHIKNENISHENFSKNLQTLHAWGLDGEGGMSGGQTFVSQLIDVFLLIENTTIKDKRNICFDVDLLEALSSSNPKGRFEGLEEEYLQIKESLLAFRKNHFHRAIAYIKYGGGKRTANLILEKKHQSQKDRKKLISDISLLLNQRIKDTLNSSLKRWNWRTQILMSIILIIILYVIKW